MRNINYREEIIRMLSEITEERFIKMIYGFVGGLYGHEGKARRTKEETLRRRF